MHARLDREIDAYEAEKGGDDKDDNDDDEETAETAEGEPSPKRKVRGKLACTHACQVA